MRYLIKEKKKKELVILSLIYLASHGMLLIASGRWWDDWCLYNQPYWVLKDMAMELGRPSLIFIVKFVKMLPEPGYRILTFIMVYFCMLFTYKILKLWLKVDDRASFWVCALYAVIPANDTRIIMSVFAYTIGLFFFMAGMSYLAGALYEKTLGLKERVVSCILFLLSFILNSNLSFYGIVLLMILMKERSIKRCFRYIEFLILPIAFFVLKTIFFPVYGGYAGYNSISISDIFYAIIHIIPADAYVIMHLFSNIWANGRVALLISVVLSLAYYVACNFSCLKSSFLNLVGKNQGFEEAGVSEKLELTPTATLRDSRLLFTIGIVSLSAGLFSYVAVRNSFYIASVGTGGRDATLVAFGAAILLFSVFSYVIKEKFQGSVFVLYIVSGVFFFNIQYLSFQQDYYRQLGFQYQISQNVGLSDAKNIVYLNSDATNVNIQSFYQLNGNAEEVFGIQNKFVMGGFGDAWLLSGSSLEYFVESGNYHMSDYDLNYRKIDAVVEYSMNIGLIDTLQMKFYELISDNRFESWIKNRSSMKVYLSGTEKFDDILAMYSFIE